MLSKIFLWYGTQKGGWAEDSLMSWHSFLHPARMQWIFHRAQRAAAKKAATTWQRSNNAAHATRASVLKWLRSGGNREICPGTRLMQIASDYVPRRRKLAAATSRARCLLVTRISWMWRRQLQHRSEAHVVAQVAPSFAQKRVQVIWSWNNFMWIMNEKKKTFLKASL